MAIITKLAELTIEAVPVDNQSESAMHPNGEWVGTLSAQTRDRDGDVLKADEWKTPLPARIPIDIDHGMSVATTVGSAVPYIDEATGNLMVRGTYASTDLAQQTRTLVNEGHITSMSVAFMYEEDADGKRTGKRELLNGAICAIPSNREAQITGSKTLADYTIREMFVSDEEREFDGKAVHALSLVLAELKKGARNNSQDSSMIQAIHDASHHLGADCVSGTDAPGEDDTDKSTGDAETKTTTDDETVDPAVLASALIDLLSENDSRAVALDN